MACENDKCEKYGLHHDYKDGVEIRKCSACKRDDKMIKLISINEKKSDFYKKTFSDWHRDGLKSIEDMYNKALAEGYGAMKFEDSTPEDDETGK